MRSVASMRSALVCKGILDRSTRKAAFPKDASDLIVELHKEGLSSKEIQPLLEDLNPDYSFSIRSIGARIASFVRSH